MISVVISAHNEEKNIGPAIDSAYDLADEVIVVDNDSSDKTSDISRKKGQLFITKKMIH